MFSVIFEVHPKPDQREAYLANANMLRPELEQVDGFVDNIRYRSLKREGEDLIAEVSINMVEATLGTEIVVDALEGPETVDIPKGTQPMDVITIKRKGVPRLVLSSSMVVYGEGVGHCAQHGAVSSQVAEALAEGIRRRTRSSIGIGVTGVAGPGGGREEKPVGLV